MLSIPHLEALVAIAELGSFRAASERLNVTQPTVSLRIKELEQSLRVSLFDRSGYRPRLTPEGTKILRLAERTLALTREIHSVARRGSRFSGKVSLGACDTFAITCLPSLLTRLDARAPDIEIALDIDYSVNLDRRLQAGQLDIAFLTSPSPGADIAIERIADIELAWIANPRLGLADGFCSAERLAAVPIITNPEPSHLYSTTHAWFERAGVRPSRIGTCSSLLHIERLASIGVAAAILPLVILREKLEEGVLSVLDTDNAGGGHALFMAVRMRTTSPATAVVREIAEDVIAASDRMRL